MNSTWPARNQPQSSPWQVLTVLPDAEPHPGVEVCFAMSLGTDWPLVRKLRPL